MSRFSGIVDKKTAEQGPAYVREIRQVRTALWAAVAQAEHVAWQIALRRKFLSSNTRSEKFSLPCEGWSAISELRRKPYLEGTRHPHEQTIEVVANHAPVSRKAFYSVLWQVLSPQTDLQTCMNTVFAFDDEKLDALVSNLLLGQAHNVAEHLVDLRATGALVAYIRLLGHERNYVRAFEVGCALTQSLCYHAVNPLFVTVAPRLWNVVSKGVLEGLQNSQFRFSRCSDGFQYFSDTLWARLTSAEALYGVHRLAAGPKFRWETIVDMNCECIRGFATPGHDRPDLLQSFLDVGSANRHLVSGLDKDPLFRSVGPKRL